MKRFFIYLIMLLFLSNAAIQAQLYSGPATGNIDAGVVLNTDSYSESPDDSPDDSPEKKSNWFYFDYRSEPMIIDFGTQQPDLLSFYKEDASVTQTEAGDTATLLLSSFQALDETNSIPPDPDIAVGPNHIMAVVNSDFAIFDKKGNLQKRINADSWYSHLFSGVGSFDPKVKYDHYNNRWIMVWLHHEDTPPEAFVFVSVSDDEDPNGIWYNWTTYGNKVGNTIINTWTDYQGVGFDKDYLYITSNQLTFAQPRIFSYVRLRIIKLSDMYNSTNAGAITCQDIWDIRYPHSTSVQPFNIRPSISYDSTGGKYYLLHIPGGSANFYSQYELTWSGGVPAMTGATVSVPFYSEPPNTQQLGGGSPPIDNGGTHQRIEPTYRDGKLYCVHSVRNPAHTNYSAVHYTVINTGTAQAIENGVFGAEGYYYMYPTIAVDKYGNIASSFSRVGATEYAGAFFATKLAYDPPGFTKSHVLQEGRANYVKTYGGSRNRWGDYQGAFLDPANFESIWFLNEYVPSTNAWDTWIGEIRMTPYQGVAGSTLNDSLNFGNVEVGFESATLTASITNYGSDDLVISGISIADNQFAIVNPPSYPLTISSNDTVELTLKFTPSDRGDYSTTAVISSNDANLKNVKLTARGYIISPCVNNKLYAVTGSGGAAGMFLEVDENTAQSNELGFSRYYDLISMAVDLNTGYLYGLRSTDPAEIVRMNAAYGDSYDYIITTISNAQSMAFDTLGTLYVATRSGEFYQVDITNGSSSLAGTTAALLNAITFNPLTNQCIAAIYRPIGNGRDLLISVDISSGDTTHLGLLGPNSLIKDLAFTEAGTLLAALDSTSQTSLLYQADLQTGTGTRIGLFGYHDVTALAYFGNSVVSVNDNFTELLPDKFRLHQNYPNPFNPSTTIQFDIPEAGFVKLSIYNILGEEAAVLLNQHLEAGTYSHRFDASALTGGIYFYRLQAGDNIDTKKMLLLK